MKGYLDEKELESYKKEDLQELAKQLGVDAEGTKKEIAARCAAVEVDIPDDNELTEEDKKAAAEGLVPSSLTALIGIIIPQSSIRLSNTPQFPSKISLLLPIAIISSYCPTHKGSPTIDLNIANLFPLYVTS